jgi:hypothetical protein
VKPRRSPAAWAAVLAWCAVAGWFAFVRNGRVPVLSLVDLGFHELGHLIMYVLPISEILTAAMGSIMQCAVPCGAASYFWFSRRDGVAACTCVAWAATNFQDASVYIADAPYQRLELIGGEHDWAFVFGPDGLNRMDLAQTTANVARGIGIVLLCVAFVGAVRGLLDAWPAATARSSASDRGVPTEATPGDLLPSTSRTPLPDPRHPSTRSSSWDHPS